jgi:hypothetical protein
MGYVSEYQEIRFYFLSVGEYYFLYALKKLAAFP